MNQKWRSLITNSVQEPPQGILHSKDKNSYEMEFPFKPQPEQSWLAAIRFEHDAWAPFQ